ncbi:hypothetical protein MPSEU_000961100 [Mayamaea pseudoterrestris]|nr:hypothetical protein MPSEU_000961100 [Mayamaea pseudoterrestris]
MLTIYSRPSSMSRENKLTDVLLGASGAFVASVLAVQVLTEADPWGKCLRFWRQLGAHEKQLTSSHSVNDGIDEYSKLHNQGTAKDRTTNYQALVNAYYDLATLFYEWGWGASFHFSFQFREESFAESIRRHEHVLAAQLVDCYGPSKHVLDVGCGIGGPMRNISKFLGGCRVTGITLNQYQVNRGNELNAQDPHCASTCKSVQGDFMKLPFDTDSLDGAYAIEATCHAPDRVKCYQEMLRVVKPGATVAIYEWCMTESYNASSTKHQQLKKDIEQGNGLPDIIDTKACLQAMKDAGFDIVSEADLALTKHVQPWETPLMPSWNIFSQRFQFNWLGGHITNAAIHLLEIVRIAPKGTVKTQKVLQTGGFALRDAAQEGIFTTMYLMVGRKPVA